MALSIPYVVTTFAGNGSAGTANGQGTSATFKNPWGLVTDPQGNLYVADCWNHMIRKITPSGMVSWFAGIGSQGTADGPAASASFYGTVGLTMDSQGNLYVGDHANHRIRKITQAGIVSTFAGRGDPGLLDGTGTAAQFCYPYGVAIDGQNNLYAGEYGTHIIRKITSAGVVSVLAGKGGSGYAEGTGTNAAFNYPIGVAADYQGNVYVSDNANQRIRKITPSGVVTTLAGNGISALCDGTGTQASFSSPESLAVDPLGNVYVADGGNHSLRKITPTGVVTTIAGNAVAACTDGTGTNASFGSTVGVAIDGQGNIYVGEWIHRIRELQ
jgi:hypothetical protein